MLELLMLTCQQTVSGTKFVWHFLFLEVMYVHLICSRNNSPCSYTVQTEVNKFILCVFVTPLACLMLQV
jgi:hypothetical protein